jgi:electron transfer flavoprotein alpha subunit
MILVVAESRDGALNRSSWEAVAAGQQIAQLTGESDVVIAVPGGPATVERPAGEVAAANVREVVTIPSPALESYTADGYTEALHSAVTRLSPSVVVFSHTYQTRDFAPKLAARMNRALVTDVTGIRSAEKRLVLVRPMFQGKLAADVVPEGPTPHFITVQVGAYRADQARRGVAPSAIRPLDVSVDANAVRQKPEPPFQEARQAVDLSQAERIVAVGRGIKDESNLPLAKALADALGAELAASRPICDAGWLPMERQVGSSGQTVAPKLYLAIGVSGAIQHLVGMKGSQVIVAINKDREAPIFEVADFGIVGDLFEVVPALTRALSQ